MISAIENLIKRVPPPELDFRPDFDDWLGVEKKLGLALPSEYKNIIELYGDYYWADFLYLLNPFSKNKYLNLFSQIEMILNAERQTRSEFPHYYPLPFYPETNGLLPFFITDNGDTGFWIANSQTKKWAILVKDARAPEFEVRFVTVATFLWQFISGRLQSVILPNLTAETTPKN